jgi:hypothetical protein
VAGKVFTMKAAAAALVAVLSIGGVAAAASGLIPGKPSPVVDQVPATTGADAAAAGRTAVADTDEGAHAGSAGGQGSAVGPDASGPARAGLCRAWQAGRGGDNGSWEDSVAFQALVDAAGGADKVAAYCEDVVAGGGAGAHGQDRTPRSSVSPPSSGPPADPGPPASTGPGGHGQGGPPATTG